VEQHISFKDIFVDETNETDDDDDDVDEENTKKTVIRKNASTCLLQRSTGSQEQSLK